MKRRVFLPRTGLACGAACLLEPELLFGSAGDGKPLLRFGMVTDLHYATLPVAKGNAPIGDRYYRDSCVKLREAVRVLNELRPDFMLELGDFKDLSPDKETTLACLREIESVFSGFSGDRYHVLGNHDLDCLTKEEFLANLRNAGQSQALPHYAFQKNGVTCVVLDACYNAKYEPYRPGNWRWEEAYIPPAELRWLETTLQEAAGPVLVFGHQRLDPNAEPRHEVRNAKQVRAVLAKSGKVKAVFTGHEHFGGTCELDGIPYYSLRALVVGAAAKSNSYALGELYPDGKVCVKGYRWAEDFTARKLVPWKD